MARATVTDSIPVPVPVAISTLDRAGSSDAAFVLNGKHYIAGPDSTHWCIEDRMPASLAPTVLVFPRTMAAIDFAG